MNPVNRRAFLYKTSVATAAAMAASANLRAADQGGRKLRVAVVALGRGFAHVQALLSLPDVEIAYLAEVDNTRLNRGLKAVGDKQKTPCTGTNDFRTFLGDKSLDAVFIATPNFWHTPAALLCMKAGKHVYVEKPGSHDPHESEMIVEASKKYDRLVQMGNQRRTWMKAAIEALHAGAIGKLKYGRTFYYNARGEIGKNALPADPGIDLNMWQGPVPDDAAHDMKKFVHYDWHWLWHWGNGELGNNGIHTLDILRWGLGVEYPQRVTYNGGRYWYKDPQETPDTGTAVYDCGDVGFEWVQSSSHPRNAEKPLAEVMFYGEGGTMAVNRDSWTVFDPKGVKTSEGKGPGGGDAAHMGNFLEAIRGNAKLNSPIEEGQKSTMLCHLGNIAYRTRTVVQFDPKTRKLINNPEGEKLWARPKYRDGWDVSV